MKHSTVRFFTYKAWVFIRHTIETSVRTGAFLLTIVMSACDVQAPVTEQEDGAGYYRVQLHLHGSLSEEVGTMRGHNHVAKELGSVDALWWTDHDWRIAGHSYLPGFSFDSEEQVYSIPTRDVPWIKNRRSTTVVSWQKIEAPGIGESWARLSGIAGAGTDRYLELGAKSNASAGEWQWAGIKLVNKSRRLIAPLSADVVVRLKVNPLESSDEKHQSGIWIELSKQVEDDASLLYVLGSNGESKTLKLGDQIVGIVPVTVPVGQWSEVELNVTEDAKRLGLGGEDNSLRIIHIGSRVREGASARMYVDDLRLIRRKSGAEVLLWAEDMAKNLEEEFDLTNHIGLEVSYGVHMNAYLPQIELPDFSRYPNGMKPREVVSWAHERGGIVSYNHVFGVKSTILPGFRETEAYVARSQYVINNDAFGADLLEVGYPHRVLPLEDHLEVWDELSRRQVYIGGVGTSDSHRQDKKWRDGNNYVTWVWAKGPGKNQLIEGLASRWAFFGDPVKFRGALYLETSDGIPMGSVVETSESNVDVNLRLEGLPDGTLVRWIEQGEVVDTFSPASGDWAYTFRVDTSDYRFVRAEVWKGERGLAFSNCLYFVPKAESSQ